MKIDFKLFQVHIENLFVDMNHPDYKWIKKHYNDPHISASEREWVDFDDSFVNVSIGKHSLKYIAKNVMPKFPMETIVIIGKTTGAKFDIDGLVLSRFMFDNSNTYELLNIVEIKSVKYNKDGVLILKSKKL